MSDPIGTYTFLPWMRRGIANRVTTPSSGMRPAVEVRVDLEGTGKDGAPLPLEAVQRSIELYGPGDVIGVDGAQISRLEPPHWVTNFEPNYLVAIEFYDEDFPWRYTPAAPSGAKLLPWLALVVLEEGTEFEEGANVAGKPLPYVDVTAALEDVFPDAAEGWAWAHVHVNAALSDAVVETDPNRAAEAAQQLIAASPDAACSRMLCPRKLKPKTAYHAFLVPAFESGRVAGLGRDPKPLFDDPANGLTPTSSSWAAYATPANRPEPSSFPVYHRWYFRTADTGDFESLVRLLKPRAADSRVGHRDVDVTDPAPNVAGIHDAELGGVLRLGGALKAPLETMSEEERAEHERYDAWAEPYPHEFQSQLAAFVNLADAYQTSGSAAHDDDRLHDDVRSSPDPLITPPLYGRWHALTERLLEERDGSAVPHPTNWVHDLNLDPRWRVAAGFGTAVVQQGQETYMEAAWEQIGDVLEANRRIRQAQLARAAGIRLHRKHVEGLARVSPALVLTKTAPLKTRVVSQGLTVHRRLVESPLGPSLTSSAMRRALRPRGRLAGALDLAAPQQLVEMVGRANEGEISAAPPKQAPPSLPTPDDLADAAAPRRPADVVWARAGAWLRRQPIVAFLLLLLLLVAIVVGLATLGALGIAAAGAVVAGSAAAWARARRADERSEAARGLREDRLTPAAVERLPHVAGFALTPDADPRAGAAPPALRRTSAGEPEADRFKLALRDELRLMDAGRRLGEVPAAVPLDLAAVAADVVSGIRPEITVPRWTWSGVTIPPRIKDQMVGTFEEVMAYPEFDTPMYEPLEDLDSDAFVPNLHLVEPDSVTLLETNQRFIEAYMVGVNHEFARELLWREYPTDQRGSYFRQFWDARKKIAEAADKEAARERFKDVKPLHEWPPAADLGHNDNREEGPAPEEELVLVIRGELLKKYPNTIVSAQPARWQLRNGRPDKSLERELDPTKPQMFPLYEARVEPDIYFFGFDVTAKDARGDDAVDDKPGYFFRIEEVPGDARFGFDVSREAGSDLNVWNDLAWPDVAPGLVEGQLVSVGSVPAHTLEEPASGDDGKHTQWESDREVRLDADVSSAELAYIALQTPVIMAIHASELLPGGGSASA